MIFIYPDREESVAELSMHCENLALPSPICWDPTQLNSQIKDLLAIAHSRSPQNHLPDHNNIIAESSFPEPIILFANIPSTLIKQVIENYKSNRKWPIFAVITPASLDMTLSCLIEHLLDDRNKEITYKKQNSTK